MALNIAVVHYSATGNVYALATALAEGAEKEGATVRLRRASWRTCSPGSRGWHASRRSASTSRNSNHDEEKPLPYLLIRQKFVNYVQWRKAYDDMAETRAQFGLRTVVLTRNKMDTDEIVVLFEFDDPARIKEYIQGPGLAEAWRRGGVVPDSNQATFLEAADDVDG